MTSEPKRTIDATKLFEDLRAIFTPDVLALETPESLFESILSEIANAETCEIDVGRIAERETTTFKTIQINGSCLSMKRCDVCKWTFTRSESADFIFCPRCGFKIEGGAGYE